MKAYLLIALCMLGALACSRTHHGGSVEVRGTAGSGSAGTGTAADGPAGKGGSASSAGRPNDDAGRPGSAGGAGSKAVDPVPTNPDAAPEPPDPRDSPDAMAGGPTSEEPSEVPPGASLEVWVGELWSVTPFLCDPDYAWSEPTVMGATGYEERTVLVLERSASGVLSGRVRFGEGELPQSPGTTPYENGQNGYWLCSIQLPTVGTEYELRSIVRSRDRLMFDILAGDVWNEWCRAHGEPCPENPYGGCNSASGGRGQPPCVCEAGTCRATEWPYVLAIDLTITADTIEGQFPYGGGFGTPGELRLTRAR